MGRAANTIRECQFCHKNGRVRIAQTENPKLVKVDMVVVEDKPIHITCGKKIAFGLLSN